MIYFKPINRGGFKNYTDTKTKLLLYHLLKSMGETCAALALVMEWVSQERKRSLCP